MSVAALADRSSGGGQRLRQAALALAAIVAVGSVAAALVWLLAPAAPMPVRSPFGMGLTEAAPGASALGRLILSAQSSFYLALKAALGTLRSDAAAVWPLVGIGFLYGVFHAAGPGHGKAVVAAYIVSSERALRLAVGLSFAAALVQSLVAIMLVGAVFVLVGGTARTMASVASHLEAAGFALVAAVGTVMTWRKAGRLIDLARLARDPGTTRRPMACDHAHLPPPDRLERVTGLRELAGIALAAGIRPCAGAILILGLALAQHIAWGGVLAVLAMGAGTALTTSLVAALAVHAKRLALRVAGGRGWGAALAVGALELAAAAFVVVIGLSLVTGTSLGEGGF